MIHDLQLRLDMDFSKSRAVFKHEKRYQSLSLLTSIPVRCRIGGLTLDAVCGKISTGYSTSVNQ